ncbi:hypothetical protein [Vibrio atypicus]|uniref:hypothetical protein n=1 Tax=Vibrio atypicus TaxID=558271 RepID=UPI003734E0B1
MKIQRLAFVVILSFVSLSSNAEPKIEAFKAPFYVGETVMACGNVSQVSQGKKAKYINLNKKYPNQELTLLIWNNHVSKFTQRFGELDKLENSRVCARGKITEYKNSLQIKLSNPQFLRLMK